MYKAYLYETHAKTGGAKMLFQLQSNFLMRCNRDFCNDNWKRLIFLMSLFFSLSLFFFVFSQQVQKGSCKGWTKRFWFTQDWKKWLSNPASCGNHYVLRQNPINSNQAFQLCNKVLRRWSFVTENRHCFSLNSEAIVILNQCQTAGILEYPSSISIPY